METSVALITLSGIGALWAASCTAIIRTVFACLSNGARPRSIHTRTCLLLSSLFLAGVLACLIGEAYLGSPAQAPIALCVDTIAIVAFFAMRKKWRRQEERMAADRRRYADMAFEYSNMKQKECSPQARCANIARKFDLTRKEEEILVHIVAGLTYPEICTTLVLSPNTVKTHARNIYRKMGVKSKEDAIRIVLEGEERGRPLGKSKNPDNTEVS